MSSYSHKKSIIPIKDVLIPIQDGDVLFPFDHHLASTQLHYPEGWDNHTVTNYGLYTGTNLCATLRKGEGKYGGAVAIEEATTNLVQNGDFSNGITHWTQSGSNTRELAVGEGYNGGNALKCNFVSSSTVTPRQNMVGLVLKSGDVLTGQAKIKLSDHSLFQQGTVMRFANLLSLPLTEVRDLRGDWKLYIYQATISEDITVSSSQHFGFAYGSQGFEFIVDEIQLELKPYASSFVDGSRPNGMIKYNNINAGKSSTISYWYKAHDLITVSRMFNILESNSEIFFIGSSSNSNSPALGIYDRMNGSWSIHPSSFLLNHNEWYHIVVKWTGINVELFVNGEFIENGTFYREFNFEGLRSDIFTAPNALFDDLLIAKRALSPEEIRAIYHSQRPLYDPNRIDHTVG